MDAAKSLVTMKVAEKRQQDKDRGAFRAVVGAGVEAGNLVFQMAAAGGRERASIGLLKVGGDVLLFLSTFLSCEKVKLVRKLKAPGGSTVLSCHVSPCSRMILTSSWRDLHLAVGCCQWAVEKHLQGPHLQRPELPFPP